MPSRDSGHVSFVGYIRRLTWPAARWASLGLASSIIGRLSRGKELLSDIEWWRLLLFVALLVILGFAMAAVSD